MQRACIKPALGCRHITRKYPSLGLSLYKFSKDELTHLNQGLNGCRKSPGAPRDVDVDGVVDCFNLRLIDTHPLGNVTYLIPARVRMRTKPYCFSLNKAKDSIKPAVSRPAQLNAHFCVPNLKQINRVLDSCHALRDTLFGAFQRWSSCTMLLRLLAMHVWALIAKKTWHRCSHMINYKMSPIS